MMTFARSRRAKGFSLIEVLVTLFIAAVGLLGIAAIVLFSLRASFESRQQSVAALLAIDVHERAWLSAHEFDATTEDCLESWVNLDVFSPIKDVGLDPIVGLDVVNTKISGAYPTCAFTVVWDQDASVVGGMFSFGGEAGGTYTHNFTIPATSGN